MKRLLSLVAALGMLAVSQGCGDSNTKSGQPKLENPSDPKIKAMQPTSPGGAGKPAPKSQ
jgi:hypothetical protein